MKKILYCTYMPNFKRTQKEERSIFRRYLGNTFWRNWAANPRPHARGQGWLPGGATHAGGQGHQQEELPRVRGQGWRPRGDTPRPKPEARSNGREELPTPLSPRPRAAAGRSNRTTEARGGGREDQPHVQGAVAARAQEGLEELSHIDGQEGRR